MRTVCTRVYGTATRYGLVCGRCGQHFNVPVDTEDHVLPPHYDGDVLDMDEPPIGSRTWRSEW